MRNALLTTIWLAMAAAVPVAAQDRPRSDSLPRDLVIALLGGSLGGRQIDIRPGLADDSLPPALFRDALLLGFADYRVTTTTVAYFPYAPQATIDTITARLVTAGWTAAPVDTTPERGFVTAYGGNMPQAICRGRAIVVPTVAVRTLNRTLAIISRQGSDGASFLCGGESRRMSRMNSMSDTPLPALTPPAGMTTQGGGGSGVASRDRAMTMTTSLSGSVPLPSIHTHYADLFTKAGWKKVEERTGDTVGVVTFEIVSGGESWHCALVTSIPAIDAADVFLTLRRK